MAIILCQAVPDPEGRRGGQANCCSKRCTGWWTSLHTPSTQHKQECLKTRISLKHRFGDTEILLLPVRKIRWRRRTRSAPGWRRSFCRRSNAGICTFGCRTSARGPAGGAVGSGTERRRNRWTSRPASPPDHWCPHRCLPLQRSMGRKRWLSFKHLIRLNTLNKHKFELK